MQEKLGDIFETTPEQIQKASSRNLSKGSKQIQKELYKLVDELNNVEAFNKLSKEQKEENIALIKELKALLNDWSGLYETMSEGKKKELMDKAKNKKDAHL